MSKLYVVGTPIGNLEDITLRALRILGEVDLILCEDTRVTGKLLAHYQLHKPMMSYPADWPKGKTDKSFAKFGEKIAKIMDTLREGKDIALVSDAGTPAVSDPGSKLVAAVREEFGNQDNQDTQDSDVEIIAVPGPSALAAALSVAGFLETEFVFFGFIPHKKGRETLFKEIASSERLSVAYESPHRILKTLESLERHLEPSRRVVVARELTKMFEQVRAGTIVEVRSYFETNSDKVRGEFVLLVAPK